MAATIGIKLANGEFYPILEEYSPAKKRLILTTVLDNQRSVQIDLYRSFTRTMADAFYIGSLLLEDIVARSKGEPSIELVITSTRDGVINAEGVDLDPSAKGEHQSLNVSLRSLDEQSRSDDIPDFVLESGETLSTGLYQKAEKVREEKKKFPWLLIICIALILTALGISICLFLLKCSENRGTPLFPFLPSRQTAQTVPETPPVTSPPVQPPPAAPVTPPPAVPPPAVVEPPPVAPPPAVIEPPPTVVPPEPAVPVLPPVIEAPATAPAPVQRLRNPPVATYNVPAVIPREGVPYTIRWGDTLWDISLAFYRTPWLYPQIARHNNIPNPDRIIAGRTIRVPPRN